MLFSDGETNRYNAGIAVGKDIDPARAGREGSDWPSAS
jgi:hypothetical protein